MTTMIRLMSLVLVISMLLGGCSRREQIGMSSKDRAHAPRKYFDIILAALEAKDVEALMDSFAPNAKTIPGLREDIAQVMEFYRGTWISGVISDGGSYSGEYIDGRWRYYSMSAKTTLGHNLVTDEAEYILRFSAVAVDVDRPSDVGLWKVQLYDAKDEENFRSAGKSFSLDSRTLSP